MKQRPWGHLLAWAVLSVYILIAIFTQLDQLASQWNITTGISYRAPCWTTDADRLAVKKAFSTSLPAINSLSPDDPLTPALQPLIRTLSTEKAVAPQADPQLICSLLGFDRWGRSITDKMLQGTRTSMIVGFGSTLLAIFIGTALGALAGFYAGGPLDDFLNGLYNVFTAVPNLLLILAIAALLEQHGLTPMVLILGLTGWTGVFRLIRAEYVKHRSRDYVLAASLLGASPTRLIIRHILPNTTHLIGVQSAILMVGFIKSEVILSYLGLGVSVDEVSWGTLLSEAQNELLIGFPWQLIAATIAMSCLTVALSRLADDYTDPASSIYR